MSRRSVQKFYERESGRIRMEIISINHYHPGEFLSCDAGVGARELLIVLCQDPLMWSLLFSISAIYYPDAIILVRSMVP